MCPFYFIKDFIIKKLLPTLLATSFIVACSSNVSTEQPQSKTQNDRVDIPYKDVIALPFTSYDAQLAYGKDPLQRIYHWPAKGTTTSSLIFIHGGCWLNAFDYTHGQAMFTALANAGVSVYAVEYRRTGDDGGGWPGSFIDVVAGTNKALDWARSNAQDAPVNLAGHSAGGHLALLVAQELPTDFDQVIGLAAITQPKLYAKGDNSCETATPYFFGGTPEEKPEAYSDATPSIENIASPVVLIQGTADQIVPELQSSLFGASRIVVPGAGHFDYLHSGSLAYREFLDLLSNGQ